MAIIKTPDVSELAALIKAYAKVNYDVISSQLALVGSVDIDKWCKKITKVKGAYHIYDSVISHVVQGFKAEWTPLGDWKARENEMISHRQKVNFPIKPANVLGSALAELYTENKNPQYKDITKKVIDDLIAKVIDDVDILSFEGEYDASKFSGVFGYSLDGWNQIVRAALANTKRPVYKIPMDALTSTNLVDQFTQFELNMPKVLKRKIKEIHVSSRILELYSIDYKGQFGLMPEYKESDKLKSPLGKRTLVGHDNQADDVIFCTVDGNMYKLIDIIENPGTISDVQVLDYDVKVFMEFELGYGFGVNEAVIVANFADTTLGLGNPDLMELYYPRDVA